MESVLEIAAQICVLAILGAVAEYILPEGRMRSSASKALGLVMLIAIARPVMEAVRGI